MIPKETVQQILDAAPIEEVVGDFVQLKKRGARYLGHCPFHNEKTPSFTVTPRLGIFKCFGCSKGGDVISFLMEHEKLSYPEAVKWLAQKYNIEIQEQEKTPEQLQAEKNQHSMAALTTFAAKYFSHMLHTDEVGKAVGLSYFRERGFRDETINKWGLGFALDKTNHFTKIALNRSYNIDFLLKTGLTKNRGTGNYDGFRNRVIFPIHNHTGQVVGFTARTLSADKKEAKYINSPESDLYHKSKVLYGLYFAKKSIADLDNCYLVEGQTDVISLSQAGIENVVASSGTSLTTDQIRAIKRYTKNITIIFDGDAAGIKAAFRGIDLIIAEGMDVKIIPMPEGHDPDSFARSKRSSEVEAYLNANAKNFVLYKTSMLRNEAKGDPMKMANLTREIMQTVAIIPDSILQANYVRECAMLLDTNEEILTNELNKLRKKQYDKTVREYQTEKKETPLPYQPVKPSENLNQISIHNQELELLRVLIRYGDQEISFLVQEGKNKPATQTFNVAWYIVSDFAGDALRFKNTLHQKVFDVAAEQVKNENKPGPRFYLSHPDNEISQLAINLLAEKHDLSDWERHQIKVKDEQHKLTQAVTDTLLAFKLRYLQQKFDTNQQNLKLAPPTDQLPILAEQNKISKHIHKISTRLGRVVLM
jgi:DNA primase